MRRSYGNPLKRCCCALPSLDHQEYKSAASRQSPPVIFSSKYRLVTLVAAEPCTEKHSHSPLLRPAAPEKASSSNIVVG